MKELKSLSKKATLLRDVLKGKGEEHIVLALKKMLNSSDILYKTRDEYRELFPNSESSTEEWVKQAVNLIMRKSK
jgi:hypothetical protein